VQAWQQVLLQEDQWHAHGDEGFRPVACDLVGFFRPRLSGCVGKHYQSAADNALPAIVLAWVGIGWTVHAQVWDNLVLSTAKPGALRFGVW
jgi:hypothetical protein